MSSGEIMGQIHYCQTQIGACEKAIAELKTKIEQQEDVHGSYLRLRPRYEERLSAGDVRRRRVEEHSTDMRVAKIHSGKMSDHFANMETVSGRLQYTLIL